MDIRHPPLENGMNLHSHDSHGVFLRGEDARDFRVNVFHSVIRFVAFQEYLWILSAAQWFSWFFAIQF